MWHGIQIEQKIIARADRISTVSQNQKYACYGEMGITGRLNKDNLGDEIVSVISNACRPLLGSEKPKRNHEYRGRIFPKTAKAILWVGGFNAWADDEALFAAMNKIMRQEADTHFLFTGKALKGIEETKYLRFLSRVEQKKWGNRVHFLGWVDVEKMPMLFTECNAGLNVDLPCLETFTGARNRINEMMRYNLPVVTTEGSEIAEQLKKHEAAVVVPHNNADELADAIEKICNDASLRKQVLKNADILKNTHFSAKIAQKCFLNWAESPTRAARSRKTAIQKALRGPLAAYHYAKHRGTRAFLSKCRQLISSKFG
jgi:glycosyltransferase involved in cell wall biosynthesis